MKEFGNIIVVVVFVGVLGVLVLGRQKMAELVRKVRDRLKD